MNTYTLSADGSTASITFQGGRIEVWVSGTFGGGTVTLEAFRAEINAWVPVDNGTWTEPLVKQLLLQNPARLRFTLSGATSPNLTMGL